jgi:acetyl-CoA synthetase
MTERETTEALMEERRLFRPLPELVANANVNPVQYEEAVRRGGQ